RRPELRSLGGVDLGEARLAAAPEVGLVDVALFAALVRGGRRLSRVDLVFDDAAAVDGEDAAAGRRAEVDVEQDAARAHAGDPGDRSAAVASHELAAAAGSGAAEDDVRAVGGDRRRVGERGDGRRDVALRERAGGD